VVKNLVGLKNRAQWHVNEIGEVRRVMTQEQYWLSQVDLIKEILNPITPSWP